MADLNAASLKQRHRHQSDNELLVPSSDISSKPSPDDICSIHSHKGQSRAHQRVQYRLNQLKSHSAWSLYLSFLFSLILIAYQFHYTLPTPILDAGQGTDPRTNRRNRFSEANVRKIVTDLSEGIGYRIVGTEQDLETQVYLQKYIKDLKDQAQREALRLEDGHLFPKFEVWTQVADGSHQFDFMSKVVMKMYTNMTNIIVRLSCGDTCDENAILLNGHYDTTLGSPGAVDDALPVGVMLEIIRIISQRPAPQKNSLIFLFNGGEESLQDASHSFITNHELKDTVKAVINLEGCGTTGPEILFQANSRPMIDAYGKVPYPHGNVIGNDIFQTGVILSDTDFRQFVDYGNLTGVDLAVYKNSYLYHTHLDLAQNMEYGLPQHLGENTLALATFLAEEGDLSDMEKTASVVYFDVFGQFFVSYSMKAATVSHIAVALLAAGTIALGASRPTLKSLMSVVLSMMMATLTPIVCSTTLRLMDKSMIWFSHEWLPVAVFGPASAAGMLLAQLMFHDKKASASANELSVLSGIQMFYVITMLLTTMLGIASSYFLAMYALFPTLGLIYNYLSQSSQRGTESEAPSVTSVDFGTFIVASAIQTVYYMYLVYSLFDLIIPLTGRIGVDAPVDHIVAVMTGVAVFSLNPPILAFAHRFGRGVLKTIIISLVAIQIAILIVSAVTLTPFDTMHPKRIFVQHLRNITSGDSLLYVAHADPGPFYEPYVKDLEELFGAKAHSRPGAENPGDWNSVYPFSQFLDSYVLDTTPFIRKHTSNATLVTSVDTDGSHIPLTDLVQNAPKLVAEKVSFDPSTGLRKLRMLCTHPSFIWTVTSFDAEVRSWSLTPSPLLSVEKMGDVSSSDDPQVSHYVIRNAGGYRSDGWRLDLEYVAPKGEQDRLRVELTAMETEGFGKDVERELKGTGEIGVMRRLVKAKPDDVALTYFSAVVSVFEL
ncbi:hypothetical protein EMPS_02846 [Entomortierella parvispora]|uniref:Peptide hydrolase n=1 Tax=Entomortierella parvispora TaxID=205924 RepID=A0A9P3H5M0_9FUNG|nr:hypothetical protein EMPS_02846 [Entomortierella parvispora]